MSNSPAPHPLPSSAGLQPVASSAAVISDWVEALGDIEPASDPEIIDCLRSLEELKSAAAAAQARLSATFESSQREEQAAKGVPSDQQGKGIGAQIALARRESPSRGGRYLGLAKALSGEMPYTLAALTAGKISEWRATLLVRETACLSVEHRAVIDKELAGDPDSLSELSDRRIIAAARKEVYRLDPASLAARAAKAANERNVTCRPAPDTMCYLTALLPVAQGVAVLAELTRAAASARTDGEPRCKGQMMADTLVERVTGQSHASDVPVQVQLVMTDRTLLAGDAEPAVLPGYGVVTGQSARDLARTASDNEQAWLRRLYTAPGNGDLVAMDSRSRTFPPGLASFIAIRDQLCATPWCDAPIRHTDHILSKGADGATSVTNGRGLCEACNYIKEAPGWSVRAASKDSAGEPTPPAGEPTGAPATRRADNRSPTTSGRRRRKPGQPESGKRRAVLARPQRTTTTTPTGHSYGQEPLPPPGHPDKRAGR